MNRSIPFWRETGGFRNLLRAIAALSRPPFAFAATCLICDVANGSCCHTREIQLLLERQIRRLFCDGPPAFGSTHRLRQQCGLEFVKLYELEYQWELVPGYRLSWDQGGKHSDIQQLL
jgi:hypothetical protein